MAHGVYMHTMKELQLLGTISRTTGALPQTLFVLLPDPRIWTPKTHTAGTAAVNIRRRHVELNTLSLFDMVQELKVTARYRKGPVSQMATSAM